MVERGPRAHVYGGRLGEFVWPKLVKLGMTLGPIFRREW